MAHLTQYGLTITLVKRTCLCLFLDSIGTHPITLIPIAWHAESLSYLLAPVVARTKLCPRAPRMWTVSCSNSEQTLMCYDRRKGLLLPILSWLEHFRTRLDNCKTSAALNRWGSAHFRHSKTKHWKLKVAVSYRAWFGGTLHWSLCCF